MTENLEFIADLISKYLHNSMTRTERADLLAWIKKSPGNKSKFEELTDYDILASKIETWLGEKDTTLPQQTRKKNNKSRNWDKIFAGEPLLKQILKPFKQTIKAR